MPHGSREQLEHSFSTGGNKRVNYNSNLLSGTDVRSGQEILVKAA